MKPLFNPGPSPNVRVILAVLMALGLLVADHHQHHLELLRTALSLVTYPLQLAADRPSQLFREARERFAGQDILRDENTELHRENLLLKARLQQFESMEAENARLRDLLGSSLDVGERVLIAEIMAVELAPYRQQVMVNKGTNAGVFVGQPVLDANAVMGQVIRANPFSSVVLLITDSDHALPVEVNRNGLRTIAAGTGPNQDLELLYIPKNADIQVDDLLVTSGMDGRFPSGYPVARVKTVRQDPDNPFTTVLAEPTARLDRSREVLLVWNLNETSRLQALTAEALKPRDMPP
ncbi:rod shape-determining protein MreC [Allochromatium humboldtianum]|uniref:Cell shape-determining protein MreC n=1 Tax=Allochromatium humboldtianum TaxID=504901 RepID=A0A850RFI6_9GAMM|nr:rod shape-determining protein MreC [Allochromatium humboldtianum]